MSDAFPWDAYCSACSREIDACLYEAKVCEGCGRRHASLFDDEGVGYCRTCRGACEVCGLLTAPGARYCSECATEIDAAVTMGEHGPALAMVTRPGELRLSFTGELVSRGIA